MALLGVMPAHASQEAVVLRLRQPAVVVGDAVQLELQLPASDARIESLIVNPPQTLQKSGSSNNVSIVNGRMSQSYTQNFQLVPREAGVITLGPATVSFNGRILQSNVVKLVVQASGAERQLALAVTAEPPDVWEGQPFLLKTTIRHGAGFRPVEFVPPSVEGIEHFEGQREPGQRVEIVHGDGAILSQVTMLDWRVPTGVGTLQLDGGAVQLEKTDQRSRRRDPFMGFFGAGRSSFSQPLPSLRVTVRPLPDVPAGLSFSGLVGQVQVRWQDVTQSTDRIKAVLYLVGTGNAANFALDSWVQNGFRVYPEAPQVRHGLVAQDRPAVSIQVALTMVPVAEADSGRPAWFDVPTGTYQTFDLPVSALAHKFERGLATTASAVSTATQLSPEPDGQSSQATPAARMGMSIHFTRAVAQAIAGFAGLYLGLVWIIGLVRRWRARASGHLEGPALTAALKFALVLDSRARWEKTYREMAGSPDVRAPALSEAIAESLYAPSYRSPAPAVRRVLEDHAAH